jgi:hypothetical protein
MLHILVLGDSTTAEMRPITETLPQSAAGSAIEMQIIPDLDAALRFAIDRNWQPDLTIVCQSWPDEFTPSAVSRLLAAFPLARLVCCFGVWCESDGRNRTIWPLSVRIPARCAQTRIHNELAVLTGVRAALPLTAARDEIFEFDRNAESELPPAAPMPIRIHSPDRELRAWLQAMLRGHGYRTAASTETPAAVVWDVDPWNSETEAALLAAGGTLPIVALMGFARSEDVAALADCGVAAVIAKLAPQADLLRALEKCRRPTS